MTQIPAERMDVECAMYSALVEACLRQGIPRAVAKECASASTRRCRDYRCQNNSASHPPRWPSLSVEQQNRAADAAGAIADLPAGQRRDVLLYLLADLDQQTAKPNAACGRLDEGESPEAMQK